MNLLSVLLAGLNRLMLHPLDPKVTSTLMIIIVTLSKRAFSQSNNKYEK